MFSPRVGSETNWARKFTSRNFMSLIYAPVGGLVGGMHCDQSNNGRLKSPVT